MHSIVLVCALAVNIPGGFDGVRDPRLEIKPRPLIDAPFVLSQTALWGATFWDVDSTFRKLDQCPTCYEGNPRMRPFVERGKGAVWGEQAKWNLGITAVSLGTKVVFRKKRSWVLRHAWLIPSLWVAGTHIKNSIHNERLAITP